MIEIQLIGRQGVVYVATIDSEDYDLVSRYRWRPLVHPNGRAYAYTSVKGKNVYMHRMLMNPPDRMVVDHIDNDGLNNTRGNLRICTRAENKANSRKPRRKIQNDLPRGVSSVMSARKGERFTAQITLDGKMKWLGTFDTASEAADAYDSAMTNHYGDHVVTNKIEKQKPRSQ